jgi:hypothetical protein
MARGWESKSVESQIEDARRPQPKADPAALDRLRRQRELESLESSRRGIVADLAATQSPVYRTALQNALAHLDEQIARLR